MDPQFAGREKLVKRILATFRSFFASEAGPTATEYAVLLGLIAVVVIGALSQFGVHMGNLYTILNGTLSVF